MATLIFVHGTFAQGEEQGDKWWQEGSSFEAEIGTLLSDREGKPLTIERQSWSGANTTSARREAGKDLYAKFRNLEAAEEPYCVIGHSHGGSAIAAALMTASLKRRPLTHLQQWITVGTPFIKPKMGNYLFLRLGDFGRALFAAILTFGVFLAIAVASQRSSEETSFVVALAVIAVAPTAVMMGILWVVNALRYRHIRRRPQLWFDKTFVPRWFGLWHEEDEAIGSLKTLTRLEHPIFGAKFALPFFSALAIFVLPLLLYLASASVDVANWIFETHVVQLGREALEGLQDTNGGLKGGGKDMGVNFNLYITTGYELANKHLFGGTLTSDHAALFLLVGLPALCLALSIVMLIAVKLLARPVSYIASLWLNSWTWDQIRQTGMGGDVEGETAVAVAQFPPGASFEYPPLCDPIATDLADTSNYAAGRAINRLRNLINKIAFSSGSPNFRVVETCLTWEELIHTNYFERPLFVKLLAYSVAQNTDFEVTPTFRKDSEYHVVAACHDQLQSGLKPVAVKAGNTS